MDSITLLVWLTHRYEPMTELRAGCHGTRAVEEAGLHAPGTSDAVTQPGAGVSARLQDGRRVAVGARDWVCQQVHSLGQSPLVAVGLRT